MRKSESPKIQFLQAFRRSRQWTRLPPEHARPPVSAGARAGVQWWWISLGAALILGTILYLGLLTLVHTAPARRALRERAIAALAARLPDARLEGTVGVDAALRLVMGPVVLGSSGDGAPLLKVDRVTVRPRLARLVVGRLEAAAVTLQGVHFQAGRHGERFADLARALRPDSLRSTRSRPAHDAPAPPAVAFSGLELRIGGSPSSQPPVILGPLGGHIHLDRLGERTQAAIVTAGPGVPEGTMEIAWGGGPGALRIRLRGLSAEALPQSLRASLPFEIRAGVVDLAFEAPRLEALAKGEGRLTLATRSLAVFAQQLAPIAGPAPAFRSGPISSQPVAAD